MMEKIGPRPSYIVAMSPWTQEKKTSKAFRTILRMVNECMYVVETQTKSNGVSSHSDGYHVQFTSGQGSQQRALRLAFVVFQARSAFHILHSQWVESPIID